MIFDKAYLIDIVNGKTKGDFPPFSTGKWKKTDKFLKTVVGRLQDIKSVNIKADFNHYGSGFSSYVHLYLSKKDKSDVRTTEKGEFRTEETNGLMLYLCRLAPYAVYSEGNWSTTYNQNKWHSGGSHYIEVDAIGTTPKIDWSNELVEISNILNQYGISILTKEELIKPIDFEIQIPTILSDPPYSVFDCMFYWED